MPRDCVINLDHIQTVARGKVGTLITTLSPAKTAQLRQALLFALGFDD
jgi:mRNA interferase MazF